VFLQNKYHKLTKEIGMDKVAFITGISGQDGSYLAELLLDFGYHVYGMIRRSSSPNTRRIDHLMEDPKLKNRFRIFYGDMMDTTSLVNVLSEIKSLHSNPEKFEVYNLAAQSHVKISFEMPELTSNIDGLGALRVLEAIRICGLGKMVRFYQASSSELYGKVESTPQNEQTPFHPTSPYAIAKLFGHWITRMYREAYGMFAVSGVLFNHESERRGINFVTRKITIGIRKIMNGAADFIELGNLNSLRDWGHAQDYVYGMYLMLQQQNPDDYVLATGHQYSVRTFCEKAFQHIGITIVWKGAGLDEVGVDSKTERVLVRVSERYFRPSEVETLLGDATKAREKLGWKPTIDIDKLVERMMNSDLKK
jgi:GDPmannose 4,6-dehydratase